MNDPAAAPTPPEPAPWELTEGLHQLGQLAESVGDLTAARDWYLAAVAGGKEWSALSLGAIEESQGMLAEAQEWYLYAARAEYDDGLNELAVLLIEQGDLEAAVPLLEAAAEGFSDTAMYNLGCVRELHGDLAAAAHCYQEASVAGPLRATWRCIHIGRRVRSMAPPEPSAGDDFVELTAENFLSLLERVDRH